MVFQWFIMETNPGIPVGPEVRAARPEQLAEVGGGARVGCVVRGHPAPATAWYKDETGQIRELTNAVTDNPSELVSDQKYFVDNAGLSSNPDGKMETFLEIKDVK